MGLYAAIYTVLDVINITTIKKILKITKISFYNSEKLVN